MDNRKHYEEVIALIPEGAERAISMASLARALQTDERSTRQIICNARIAGYVIAACNEGYYLPITLAELEGYYVHVQKRQKTTALEIAAVRRRIKELKGGFEIDE